MNKKLSEMTLEELWQLFPIVLTKHNDHWKDWYEKEAIELKRILASNAIVRISHVGSTAIDTIWAKPIIDILVEISENQDMQYIKKILLQNGYVCMCQSENRISFNKGYTENGFAEKVYHVHLRYDGDHDEIFFRDYLNENPSIAKEYEELKLRLWKEYEHNRDGYTDAKTEFVRKYTYLATQNRSV